MNLRPDLALIASWIRPGSRVLDLGCGDGALLAHLQQTQNVSGYGIEIDPDKVTACIRNGVNVLQSNLDQGLSDFDEASFDYVIMSQTLQAVRYPDAVLNEMLRVGREGIVTFPNFGHIKPRLYLAMRGLMPVSPALPHTWYNTPNIHLCTLRDFERLCRERGIRIHERKALDANHQETSLSRFMPNLFGEIALYRFQRDV